MNSGPVAQFSPKERSSSMIERSPESVDGLAGEHRTHRFDGAGDHTGIGYPVRG